jgi:pyruvate/2-oxoglutarate dehydrogenase complex dihydrolipoamide dehydrogenase (E3) component/uncharacterized membrane protein YdjX (TVP38/TMEM64 family)
MNMKKINLLLLIGVLIALFFALDLHHALSLENIKAQQAEIEAYRQSHPLLAVFLYAALYIAVTSLSLPGAAALTLVGGGIFGLFWSTIVVSFASTIGATLAFLAARFLFRDWIKNRFGHRLQAIEAGLERDGAYYLFTLRLVPIFPFFLINLAMGLTAMPVRTFYWISQVGMLAGTVVYVNAGAQLAKIDSVSGIFSPGLLASFALLGFFPLLTRKILDAVQQRKVYAGWQRPAQFDNNLIVIGAGAGGLVTAYIAAAAKAKVTLVEKHRMGGDCLYSGCVPSKALIRSARFLAIMKRAAEFGIREAKAEFDFADVMQRVQRVIKTVEPHDSVQRYSELGVEVVHGEAKIVSPWAVEISGESGVRTITTRAIVIAAGARPFVPPIPGLEQIDYLTSDTVWDLRECPRRLLVLGGGPIGCELAQALARLGSQVTLVEMAPRLLLREDPEVSEAVMARFVEDGISVLLGHRAKQFNRDSNGHRLQAEFQEQTVEIAFDRLLVAIGRSANLHGYGIEELGIRLSPQKTVDTDAFQRSNYPNIFAVGDVAGPYQFTHAAAHQAWHAAVNALFGDFKKFRTDYSAMPWATFTDPEVARVGLNEQDAQQQGLAYEVSVYGLDDLDRAIADGEARGFVKVLTAPGSDRILGVTIVGEHAGDLIAEFVLAMRHGLGLNKILATVHIYPTLVEANKYAAGVWKKAQVSKALTACLARFHAWRRKR